MVYPARCTLRTHRVAIHSACPRNRTRKINGFGSTRTNNVNMIKSAIEKWLHLLNEKQNTLPFREILVHQRPQSMHQLRVVRCGNQLQLRFYGEDSSEIISRLN